MPLLFINSKMRNYFVFVSLLLLLTSSYAQTENDFFTRIETEHGLPPGNVNDIVQDKYGFIWLGTETGLARFDGYNFKVFNFDKDDSTSLAHNNIFSLHLDGDIIWIGTLGGGLNKFDINTGKVKRFVHNPSDSNSISHNNVYKVFLDSKNRIWASTLGGGLNLLDQKTGKFKRFQADPGNDESLQSNMASSIFEDENGEFWIGTFDTGLYQFNPKTGCFKHYKADGKKNSLSHKQVMDIIRYDENHLLVATFGDGVNLFNYKKKEFRNFNKALGLEYKTNSKLVRKLFDDGEFIWIGTHLGLHKLDKLTNQIKYYRTDQKNKNTINNNSIREIFEDNSGLIWIGTNYGINTYSKNRKKFEFISFEDSFRDVFVVNTPSLSKKFWQTSDNQNFNSRLKYFGNKFHNGKIKHTGSLNHYIDNNNVLWTGSYRGLRSFNKKTKEFEYLKFVFDKDNQLINEHLRLFFYDRNNVFWGALGGGGLLRIDQNKGEVERYLHSDDKKHSLIDSRISTIYEDMFGMLWIGTYGGLDIYYREKNEFRHVKYSPTDSTSISNERILSIYETKAGQLWIGTYQGLNRYDRHNNKFIQVNKSNGLEGNTIYNMIEDDSGNLWLQTNKGISKFNPVTREIINYNESDGLKNIDQTGGFCYKSADGKLHFSAKNGFNSFYPDEIASEEFIPPVVFTSLKIMNKEVNPGENSILSKPLNDTEIIEVSYLDKLIELEFSALHYTNPLKNKYAYKIENLYDNWEMITPLNRKLTLANLSPGKYKIIVNGTNVDGKWNPLGKSITLIINPPFYKSWWFRILAAVIFIVIVFYIYEVRLNRLVEIERTRTRIARNLHDEVGGTLASIQYFVNAIRKTPDKNSREKFLNLINDSSSDAQEKIRDIIWTVNPEEDGLNKFFVKFTRYTSDIFDSKHINFVINVPEKITDKNICMDKRQHLWCICKETVTNTIKHSSCSNVKIDFKINNNDLYYSIKDDGVGYAKNDFNSGNGLRNIENRAKMIKAEYKIDSDTGKGFKFEMTFRI